MLLVTGWTLLFLRIKLCVTNIHGKKIDETNIIYSDASKTPKTPTTPVPPVSVGGEMLARSPIGSVADLSSKLPLKRTIGFIALSCLHT